MNWTARWEERERNRPGNLLREKIKAVLKVDDDDAREIVHLLEELISEKTDDLEHKINKTGDWSPDY
jgi:hypothetical protein